MINLFENYTERERDLEFSLKASGQSHLTIVLDDNGFLPSHIVSPVGFFTKMDTYKRTLQRKPKFFNDLQLPPYWEIRANSNFAEIFEGYKKKGHINYSNHPGDYRFIQSVEWLNESGRIRAMDLYNQNGLIFGKETYSDGEHVLTSYLDESGREVILFNHILGTIQLDYNEKKYIFSDYSSFVLFYLDVAQVSIQRILYTSLGRPYFVTHALKKAYPKQLFSHFLFWQEESQHIPGNMLEILEDNMPTTRKIIVQDYSEYERLRVQAPAQSSADLSYLGYVFNFKREAVNGSTILIHTNSDQLELINELVQALPQFKFNISARTEMSQRLMQLEEFCNVSLYPNITTCDLDNLIEESNIYLDINQGEELDNILRQSFENNLLLLAFANTLHNPRLISPSHVFEQKDYTLLVEELQAIVQTRSRFIEALNIQQHDAGHMTLAAYKEVLK